MILSLSGEINYLMFEDLIKSFNSLKKAELLHLYFSSEGGYIDVAEAMIDFINSNSEKILITFYGEIFSAAMYIFLKAKCKKLIVKDTRGMFHFSWQIMEISEGGKPTSLYNTFSLKEMRRSKEIGIAFLKTTLLSEKEINNIKQNKDVYFSFPRMRELVCNAI
jgi:ATP-dependent protease ClpP protease subunit